jgi:hypothetical protein
MLSTLKKGVKNMHASYPTESTPGA